MLQKRSCLMLLHNAVPSVAGECQMGSYARHWALLDFTSHCISIVWLVFDCTHNKLHRLISSFSCYMFHACNICTHRGLGRQASLMWFNILGFWMVGFTMGWALTFKAGLGLSGIWLGILSGVTTTGMPCAAYIAESSAFICCYATTPC